MTDFSEAYDSVTDQINSFVSTQINSNSTWNAIPGGLDKVSTSSVGFAWGIGSGTVFSCQLPCEGGNWQRDELGGAIDIVTDDMHVYVLTSNSLEIKMANNTDEWISITVPAITSIFSTSAYIWGQDNANKKYRLSKPGITAKWVDVDDITVKITSSAGNALYGVNASGTPMKSDQVLQSGWTEVPMNNETFSKVIGDIDQTALYGVDTTNKLKRCVSGNCNPVLTNNLVPRNVFIDSGTKTLWMTTETQGDIGNIFTKQDSTDTSNFLAVTGPLDKQRDSVVDASKMQFQETTHTTIMQKQVKDVLAFIKKFFNFSDKSGDLTEKQKENLKKDVVDVHTQVQQLQQYLPALKNVSIYIVIAVLLYWFGSFLGWMINWIVFGILAYGVYSSFLVNGTTSV
jgi:hypothetical protein